MATRYGATAYRNDGSSSDKAAPSALAIKRANPSALDGVYWINLPVVGATQIYCIMDNVYDGGGWMMAMKATRGTTFNYDANYWTASNTLNTTAYNQSDGDAKFDTMNYYRAKDMMARFPDVTTGTGGSVKDTGAWTWLENDFNSGSRATMISFFNQTYTMNYGGSGFFIKDAKTFSGWESGIFSSQVDVRFYGFNYNPNPTYGSTAKVRWGFGWNENGEGLYPSNNVTYIGTNDVSGGIGMTWGSYSAGDYINCCQDSTGLNRSMRTEVYIR